MDREIIAAILVHGMLSSRVVSITQGLLDEYAKVALKTAADLQNNEVSKSEPNSR